MEKLIYLLIVFLSSNIFYTSISKSAVKYNLKDLKKQLKINESTLKKLNIKLQLIDKNIDLINERYSKMLMHRKKMEDILNRYSSDLKTSRKIMEQKKKDVNHAIKLSIVNSMDKDESIDKVIYKKISVVNLKNKLNDLEDLIAKNIVLDKKVMDLKQKYDSYLKVGRDLLSLISKLEEDKYSNRKESYNITSELKNIRSKLKSKSTFNKPTINKFISPIDNYLKYSHGKKGITYFFKGKNPIKSVDNGKIVYTGKLSVYGNVVIIEHSKELRSILLGSFNPIVIKGDDVTTGQIIGYTKISLDNENKVYFEIRRKNIAQNTAKYIFPKYLSNKNRII